jgi:hypothetical protein
MVPVVMYYVTRLAKERRANGYFVCGVDVATSAILSGRLRPLSLQRTPFGGGAAEGLHVGQCRRGRTYLAAAPAL